MNINLNIMSKCFIGCGEIPSFFKYMIAFIVFNIAKDLCYKFGSLKYYKIIGSLYKYFIFATFGFLFYYISIKRYIVKKDNKKIDTSNSTENKKNKLIYNKISLNKELINQYMYYSICFFYVIFFESLQLIDYFGFSILFIWTFDFLSMLIFINIFYSNKMFLHQKCSMLFIIIVDTALLFIASFIKIDDVEKKNIYDNKGITLSIGVIFIFIFISSLNSFNRVKIKSFMDNQFILPYQIIFFIGIFGFIINLIISIVFLIKGNNCDENCFDKDNDKNCTSFDCYSNVSYYFKNKEFLSWKIIFIILYMIFYFLSLTCEFFIIKYLDPFHVTISEVIYYGIFNFFSYFYDETDSTQFIIKQIAEGLAFIGFCVFLEIIELRFCDLNKNVRKNIIKREREEIIITNELNIGITDDDIIDNNEEYYS